MENKLELKHLASYLPYGVKVIHEDEIKEIHGIINDEIYLSYNDIGTDNNYCFAEDIILILRPLSQLTTEIEHEGEKFVPIIELYKYSNKYNYNNNIDYEFVDSWGAGKILKVYHNKEKTSYTEFIFSNLSFRKDRTYNKGSNCFGFDLPHSIVSADEIYHQYKLFDKLLEWHFDIYGLIDKNLAIELK